MRLVEDSPEDRPPYEDVPPDSVSLAQARSVQAGKEFDHEAFAFLERMDARIIERYVAFDQYPLDALIEGANGVRFYVDAHGTPDRRDDPKAGMRRTDTMLKFGFKAMRLHQHGCPHPLLLITSHMPRPGSKAAYFLSELNDVLFDAVATVDDFEGVRRLSRHFNASEATRLPAPWRETQLTLQFHLVVEDFE